MVLTKALTTTLTIPTECRSLIRKNKLEGNSSALCPGYLQANLTIVPAAAASSFADFCNANREACPLLERLVPGSPAPERVAQGADIRTDLTRYCLFRPGKPAETCTDISHFWSSDAASFLTGCSFSFDQYLSDIGLVPRHLAMGVNVPMFKTQIQTQPAGCLKGPLVVSMRPFARGRIEDIKQATGQFPEAHGAPVWVGNPERLGIKDLYQPDWGDPVPVYGSEVPVFWACGVTAQLALSQAVNAGNIPWAISHAPGCMFICDQPISLPSKIPFSTN